MSESRKPKPGINLGQLLANELPRLAAYARLHAGPRLRARESVSDLVNSVCKDLLAGAEGFEYRGDTAFRSYLLQAVLNKVRQRQRQLGREKRNPDREKPVHDDLSALADMLTPSRHAIGRETVEQIEAAFDELPESYRQAIALSRLGGLSQHELAVALGKSVAAARNLLHRATVRFAGLLDRRGVRV